MGSAWYWHYSSAKDDLTGTSQLFYDQETDGAPFSLPVFRTLCTQNRHDQSLRTGLSSSSSIAPDGFSRNSDQRSHTSRSFRIVDASRDNEPQMENEKSTLRLVTVAL